MTSPRILMFGAGGVGGYYGARLIEKGGDVTFFVRPKRQKYLSEQGLNISSPAGDVHLGVKTVSQNSLQGGYDFIFLTPKAYDLDDTIETIKSIVDDKCAIVPLLNGLQHMEKLNQCFGPERVMGGSVKIQVTLTQEGIIKHFNKEALITVGEQNGQISQRLALLARQFEGARALRFFAVDNIMQCLWNKWMSLSALAGMTCLMRADIGTINRSYGGPELIKKFIAKNLAVAEFYGYGLDDKNQQELNDFLLNPNSSATASMLRDVENNARVENEQILGDLLRRAEGALIDHDILASAYCHLQAYERRQNWRQ